MQNKQFSDKPLSSNAAQPQQQFQTDTLLGSVHLKSQRSSVERRVDNFEKLIASIAQRFSSATGWPLRFISAAKIHNVEAWQTEARERFPWYGPINDGRQVLGFLCLELPGNARQDKNFFAVQELAELTRDLVNRIYSLNRTLEHRTRELWTVVELGMKMPRHTDVLEAVSRLLKAITELTPFRAAAFFLLDPTTRRLNLRLSHMQDEYIIPEPSRDLTEGPPDLHVLLNGSLVLHRNQTGSQRWLPPNVALAVGVIVGTRNGPIGTLWVYDRRSREPSDRELRLVQSLAAQIALVLERVVLLKESESQHRLQRELQSISESQPSPQVDRLPSSCGFEAALKIDSRHELGGDLCEIIPVSEHQTVIVVGDASGDSIPAAIVMTSVRGALRALAAGVKDDISKPEAVVERVNRALVSLTPSHQFMTFLYGVYDARDRSFCYCNAGHPGPLLVQDGKVQVLESHGLILGILENADYGSSRLELQTGDVLIFYSDGISEAMSYDGRMFRTDGIVQSLQGWKQKTAAELLEAIWQRYQQHIQGAAEPDDRTLLVIKVK